MTGVFHSLPSILSYLEKHKHEKEVAELVDIFEQEKKKSLDLGPRAVDKSHLLLVFEGLDGAGKSRMTRETAKKLNAKQMSTPPEVIKHLRPYFDRQEVGRVMRRAFYSLGNYIAAFQLDKILRKSPVVVDRYWHSTAAYAIAENKDTDVPPDTFIWPSDLLKPDVSIFLTVSEHIRLQRMSKRENYTAEENQLRADAEYRKVLTEMFRKMENPSLKFVNCDGFPKTILKEILSIIEEDGKTNPQTT